MIKCPVCKQEARTHIFKCALHGVYVHEKCWKEHVAKEHKDGRRRTPGRRRSKIQPAGNNGH